MWGPHHDALDPAEWRLTVTELADGTYDWQLDGRNRADAANQFETLIEGNASGEGTGAFIMDFDAAERVNPRENDGAGQLGVSYDLAARHLDMDVDQIETRNGTPTPVHYDYTYGEGAAGSYQALVAPGTHDLVFAEDGPRMLIRRAEAITADRVLDVDMAAGFDRTLATVTVTGAGAEPVTVSSELHTLDGAGTYVPMSGAGDQIWLVPAAQRVATDRMVAMATLWTGDTTRVVQRLVTDATAPALTFAAPPTVTADRAGATWTTEPDWIYTVLRATVAPPVQVITTASRAWQAARGGGALPWLDPSALGAGAPTFTAGAALEWSVALETGDRAGELTFINRDGPLVW